MSDEDKNPTRHRRLRRGLMALCGLVVLAGVALGAYEYYDAHRVPRFGCVVPGVLYRSGQPAPAGFRQVVRRHGIRTVVILRRKNEVEKDPRVAAEYRIAKEHGVRVIHLPFDEDLAYQQLKAFMDIMAKSANHPVLVHCAKGRDRTGLFVMAYRMGVQGWERDRAMAELHAYHFERDEAPRIWRLILAFVPSRL
ncbi:tyrosine-protein phosphatase [bacterium]|nr:tyrosine-protein phosphatase [bacterium]